MTNFVPVNKPKVTDSDISAVTKSLRQGWISGDGPVVEEFEGKFANFCNRNYASAVSNGTVAIDLAYEALGIGKNDEVLVPSFTIISCISYLLRVGAKPVFVDSDPYTWNLEIQSLDEFVNPNTKAIFVPHIYGLPADMDPIIEFANRHNLKVIEDAAEAHGQTYRNKICGSFGDVSVFSFYANKNITTGEGGMVLSDDENLIEKIKNLKNLNFRHLERFVSDDLGYNYRMSSIQAALGSSQLDRIDDVINRRIQIGNFYNSRFENLENIQLPLQKTQYAENHYWVYGLKLSGKLSGKAKELQNKLHKEGIGTRPFFQPLHTQPVLAKFGFEKLQSLPHSLDLGQSGFYIPNGLGTTDQELEYVADKVVKVIHDYSMKF